MAPVNEMHGTDTVRQSLANRPDPFDFVWALGNQTERRGQIAGGIIASVIHSAVALLAIFAPMPNNASQNNPSFTEKTLFERYDIELDNPRPEPAPEPEPPEPEPPESEPKPVVPPQPVQRAPGKEKSPPHNEQPAPAAAQAGSILSAPEQEDSVDLTEFVTGSGNEYVGGVTASAGTATVPTYNRAASTTGVVGGTGTAPSTPQPAPPKVSKNLQRSATIASGTDWSSCPFPPQADIDQVDYARVTLKVMVNPDGTAQSVQILSDPGHGFGRAAARCAKSKRYVPALNDQGRPITDTTPPIRVTFTR